MKNLIKRIFLLALAAIMVLQFTGCGNKSKGNADFEIDLESDSLISKEPIELTYFFRASKDDDGQWGIFKEAAKMTGIFAKTTVSKSNSNLTQSFNLMLASGEIDDIVFTQDENQFVKYGMDGAFVQLDQHFDKMPNFKAFLDANPEVKRNLTAIDGHIYYTPFCQAGKTTGVWFVRQDWMEKLGLKNPTNAEELYTVLKAFKTQDPNGNGKADEVPYFAPTKNKLGEIFTLWNARQGWYAENGKVKFGPLDPEYKTAMQNIIQWYKEGLFDKEILTATTASRDRMLMDNIGGMTLDWVASTARYNDTVEIPGFKFTPFAPPMNIILGQRSASANYGWGIYSGTKYLDEAVKFLDFWFSEAGSNLINFGKEGEHWDMVDGKPVFKPELLAKESPQQIIQDFGAQMGIGFKQNFDYELQWMNQIAFDGMKLYEEGNWFAEVLPSVSKQLTAEEKEEYITLSTAISTHYDEIFQKWVMGIENFDATYEKFIKDIERMGIDRLVELMQTGYDRYMSID